MIALKLRGQNERGIPAGWPQELRPDATVLPDGFDFLLPSAQALAAYQAEHQAAFDAWQQSQPVEAPPVPVPESVTPRQIRWALNAAGLRATVEGAIASADQNTKDAWEFSNEVRRDNPLVTGLAAALGMSAAQLDDLFRLAASFD